jgi:hypothetical protein
MARPSFMREDFHMALFCLLNASSCRQLARGWRRPPPVRIRIRREGALFVAQCLDFELASQGRTRTEARANLGEAIVLRFGPSKGSPSETPKPGS